MSYNSLIVDYDNQTARGWKWYWRVEGAWKRGDRWWPTYDAATYAGRKYRARYIARHENSKAEE